MKKLKKLFIGCACALSISAIAPTASAVPTTNEILTKWEESSKTIEKVTVDGMYGGKAEYGSLSLFLKANIDFDNTELSALGGMNLNGTLLPAISAIVKDNVLYFSTDMATDAPTWQKVPINETTNLNGESFNLKEFSQKFNEVDDQNSKTTQLVKQLFEKYFSVEEKEDGTVILHGNKNISPDELYADYELLKETVLEEAKEKAEAAGEEVNIDELRQNLDRQLNKETLEMFLSQTKGDLTITFNKDGRLVNIELTADDTNEDSTFEKISVQFDYEQEFTIEVPQNVQ